MNEKEILSDFEKQDSTQGDDLPDWFCLIQTSREYYIKQYRKIMQGSNKAYFTFVALFFASCFLFVFKNKELYKYVTSYNFIEKEIKMCYLFLFICNIIFVFPAIKIKNKEYFKQTKLNYKRGYRPDIYTDTSAAMRNALIFCKRGYYFILLSFFTFFFFDLGGRGSLPVFFTIFATSFWSLFSGVFVGVVYSVQFINDRIKLRRHLKDLKQAAD
ncbi:MAG: hypothetical protein CNLJKLNK_01210 [Holosporales bacterium]